MKQEKDVQNTNKEKEKKNELLVTKFVGNAYEDSNFFQYFFCLIFRQTTFFNDILYSGIDFRIRCPFQGNNRGYSQANVSTRIFSRI
jgi:hypothetical protein